MHWFKRTAALTAIVLAGSASAEEAAPAALPGWMAGCWEQRTGESWTEECWTGARAGMMMGSGRSGTGQATRNWEVMQIVRQDSDDPTVAKMVYYGAPQAQNRTPFQLVEGALPGVTFVNAEHDYPQRIRYWREGNELVAEVSLKDGSKARRWRYRRLN